MRRHRFLFWSGCENAPVKRCLCAANGINRDDQQKRFAAGVSIKNGKTAKPFAEKIKNRSSRLDKRR